ncbi:hypothetical protein HPB47_025763 [Ixodes persulcatus]|uniref:Uncharacterized protein n=1 Tax=Ixodes persulcatus TaxID=34615 RepID=A0AC60Q296_IXOPE|nr:hypothetical protein HPB47_025763 [Ixodes persulcatus]
MLASSLSVRVMGVLYVGIVDFFGVTREEASWPLSLQISTITMGAKHKRDKFLVELVRLGVPAPARRDSAEPVQRRVDGASQIEEHQRGQKASSPGSSSPTPPSEVAGAYGDCEGKLGHIEAELNEEPEERAEFEKQVEELRQEEAWKAGLEERKREP